jgi:hypothetical protein
MKYYKIIYLAMTLTGYPGGVLRIFAGYHARIGEIPRYPQRLQFIR